MSMSTNEGNLTRVTVDLLLTGVYREDTGVYVCSAINILNNVTRNINLIVKCTFYYPMYIMMLLISQELIMCYNVT